MSERFRLETVSRADEYWNSATGSGLPVITGETTVKPRIRTGFWLAASIFGMMATWPGTEARAYQLGPVKQGATVRGSVTVTGTVPAPKDFELRRYPDHEYCSKLSDGRGYRRLREVTFRPDGAVKDVVVSVEGVEQGKPFSFTEAEVEANLCQFLPFVTVISDTRHVTVFNRDPVPHDIQGLASDQTGNDMVFYRPSVETGGTTDLVQLAKDQHVFTMRCSLHPYMQNWGYAVDNPYYAVTDATGSFSIEDLPPGTYRLKAWHPILGTREQELTVAPNEVVSLDLSFTANF